MEPSGPVYHGSGHGFKEGDTINPTPDKTHMKGEKGAFGVTNTSTAGYFAVERTAEPREGQGQLFASVYEVGPKSEYEIHPSLQHDVRKSQKYAKGNDTPVNMPEENTMPIDRKGFEVKRHAAFAFPDQEGAKKGHLYEKIQPTP